MPLAPSDKGYYLVTTRALNAGPFLKNYRVLVFCSRVTDNVENINHRMLLVAVDGSVKFTEQLTMWSGVQWSTHSMHMLYTNVSRLMS